jgi:hypothetical protein
MDFIGTILALHMIVLIIAYPLSFFGVVADRTVNIIGGTFVASAIIAAVLFK